MKIIDITKPLAQNMPSYPGDPNVLLEEMITHDVGIPVVTSKIQMGSHSGTHIDAPAHIDSRLKTVTEFPLEGVQGEAMVIENQSLDETYSKLNTKINQVAFLIIKSSEKESTLPLINNQLASDLKSSGVCLIGTDRLSVDNDSLSLANHQNLLREDIWIIENLDLSKISEGVYGYIIAPLKVSVRDGAPVRAFLTDANCDCRPELVDIKGKAKLINSRMSEAEQFVNRAGIDPYDSFKLNIIAHLWLAADEKDDKILECLQNLNESITNNTGSITVERGATPQRKGHVSDWGFHCQWQLSWDDEKSVVVNLITLDESYQPHFEIVGTNSKYQKILLDINDVNTLELSLINCTLVETYNINK